MEFNLLPHESDAAATSLLPLPLLSCGPRSMVPLSVPSSSDLGTILSPDPIYTDLQLKEINYNAAAESTEFLHLILSGNDEEYNTATEFQVWDFLDFYVTEKISAQQFDNLMGFTNETLVQSTLDHCDNADFTLEVFFNMKNNTVYVRERPHLKMFLEKTAQMFEPVIFTASQRIYAEQLIDRLDPDGKLVSRRVYRDSCKFSDGCYAKDLTVLGVDLAKIAIVDNAPQVFQLQVDNGIPIKSWFDDPSDQELVELLPFLDALVDAEDVRPIISKTFDDKLEQI